MPYKINKIILQREWSWGYETFFYDLKTEIDFPFVAGKLDELVPKDYPQIKKYRPDIDDFPLFNESGLTKLTPEVGPKGIYYLELQPRYKLKQLIVEPEDVVVDIYFGAEERLIYSFYNPTRRNNITITAASEKDKDNVHSKLKSDPTDIYWRQYFVRLALNKMEIKKSDAKVSENMNAKEVADYLRVGTKTIRNWTSEGKIPSVKIGSAVRYPKERIDNWLKTKEKKVVRSNASKQNY
jgi:excisionase family DNA binding protein